MCISLMWSLYALFFFAFSSWPEIELHGQRHTWMWASFHMLCLCPVLWVCAHFQSFYTRMMALNNDARKTVIQMSLGPDKPSSWRFLFIKQVEGEAFSYYAYITISVWIRWTHDSVCGNGILWTCPLSAPRKSRAWGWDLNAQICGRMPSICGFIVCDHPNSCFSPAHFQYCHTVQPFVSLVDEKSSPDPRWKFGKYTKAKEVETWHVCLSWASFSQGDQGLCNDTSDKDLAAHQLLPVQILLLLSLPGFEKKGWEHKTNSPGGTVRHNKNMGQLKIKDFSQWLQLIVTPNLQPTIYQSYLVTGENPNEFLQEPSWNRIKFRPLKN